MSAEVRVIDGRPRYHLASCVHLLGRESEPLPVHEALELEFTPCGVCEPNNGILEGLLAPRALAADKTTSGKRQVQITPAREAGRIVYTAARVLPVGDRARYHAEYRSELYELAAAGVSRWGQVMYAVRLVDRAWVLRAELRATAVRRTGS
jgi:hypothetical protein